MNQTKKEKTALKRLLVLLLSCAIAVTGLAACKDKQKEKPVDKPKTEVQQKYDNSLNDKKPAIEMQTDKNASKADNKLEPQQGKKVEIQQGTKPETQQGKKIEIQQGKKTETQQGKKLEGTNTKPKTNN